MSSDRQAAHLSTEIDFCNRSNVTLSPSSYINSPPPLNYNPWKSHTTDHGRIKWRTWLPRLWLKHRKDVSMANKETRGTWAHVLSGREDNSSGPMNPLSYKKTGRQEGGAGWRQTHWGESFSQARCSTINSPSAQLRGKKRGKYAREKTRPKSALLWWCCSAWGIYKKKKTTQTLMSSFFIQEGNGW